MYVESRRAFLLRTQNADGGWGYFPGKASWLEPTAYAMLALYGQPESADALQRAWRLVAGWQLPDGSWRPGSEVGDGAWVTALAVNICSLQPAADAIRRKGIEYLLRTEGAERCFKFRVMEVLGLGHIEQDTSHPAWPWRPGTSSWIEPTVHSVIALKKSAAIKGDAGLKTRITVRIHEGEAMILSRRCADGGWNHGASVNLSMPVPSYPESTGLALLALQGRAREAGSALTLARRYYQETKSPLARAWLAIALRAWGDAPEIDRDQRMRDGDIMLAALQALAHPDGNHSVFRTGEAA